MRVSRTRFSKRRSKRKTEFPIVAVVQKKRKGQYLKSSSFGTIRNDVDFIKEQKNNDSPSPYPSPKVTPSVMGNAKKATSFNENQSNISPQITSFRPQKKSRATIDYKNVILLRNLITAEGKILPRRISKLTAKQQRYVQKAIKSARIMGLIPFINKSRPF